MKTRIILFAAGLCAVAASPSASAATSKTLVSAPGNAPTRASVISDDDEHTDEESTDETRTDEWPDVKGKEALRTSVAKIRKATNDEMERQGFAEILAMGPSAAPLLLKSLGKERNEDARERIVLALDSVTTAKYTPALAKSFGERSAPIRNYVLQRVAILGDPSYREDAEELWADLQERLGDKRKKGRVDADTVKCAALLAFSCGSTVSIAHVIEQAGKKGFSRTGDILNPVAASARRSGEESGEAVAAALIESLAKGKPMKERLGALRLLTFAGTKANARAVVKQLDAAENQVKIAAINALRQIVDGDPPIKKLSAFDAIERAKKWKSKL